MIFGTSLLRRACVVGCTSGRVSSIHLTDSQPYLNSTRRWFGAGDIKLVAARMKSVKSIQKITKAMKMVAASKLKADHRRMEQGLPFSDAVETIMSKIPREKYSKGDVLIVPFTSDKGLCGGVNSAVARETRLAINEVEAVGGSVKLLILGDKGRAALLRLFGDRIKIVISECTKNPWSFTAASVIAERILKIRSFHLIFIHNHFRSAISYDSLKLDIPTPQMVKTTNMSALDAYEFEPERSYVWDDLHSFFIGSKLYTAMLDNIASEQSARMNAMDNASSNAGDMLASLTLRYNRARQAKITTELIEIISGANAL